MTKAMKSWLSEHGLTATNIADAMGYKYSRIYRILDGRLKPPAEFREMMIDVYGMTEEEYKGAMK